MPREPRLIRDVGRRVAELRRALGWRQVDLAEALGVSLPYVCRIEQGRENLTLRSLEALAAALRAKPRAFFEPPTEPRARRGRPPVAR